MSMGLLSQPTPQVAAAQSPRLLDQVAQAARHRGASEPTTAQLVAWVRAYVVFHGKRHPRELNFVAVTRFLEHVVRTEKQPLPALESARSALELLYGTVLGIDLGELPRPRRCKVWFCPARMA
ncbi:MAG: phage integrase N-terminal SAM-like domain-containing protein [Gemmataceae bacterium]|nr:phage integrase N-terminal SAM-like domain-containing protein [Gemmataceae bacterium]